MRYSLVIPCFNEGESLSKLYARCRELTQKENIEVLLVDNGSTDNTQQLLSELCDPSDNIKIVNVAVNRGYGFGILAGLQTATGDYIGWTHADLQTDPIDFVDAARLLEQKGENYFVKGRRSGRPMLDVFFTVGMSIFESLLMAKGLWDINAQPTVFHKEFFNKWVEDAPHDFSLDLFVYYMAKKHGLKVARIPVLFVDREFGHSHWNINFRSKLRFIWRTVKFSLSLRRKV